MEHKNDSLTYQDIRVEEQENLKKLFSSSMFTWQSRLLIRLSQKIGMEPWLPFSGVWKPKNPEDGMPIASGQPLVANGPRASLAAGLSGMVWRGTSELSESMGVVSGNMVENLARVSELPLDFLPFSAKEWATAPIHTARWSQQVSDRFLEVQVPGLFRALDSSACCLRFLFNEFGLYDHQHFGVKDLYWVPSFWCRNLLPTELQKRCYVIPHGYNAEVFSPGTPRTLSKKCKNTRFLYIGTTLSRKGFDILLDAWRQRRHKKGTLVLKLSPTMTGFLSTQVSSLPRDVELISDQLGVAALAALYRRCDVIVAPSRAEGFGLPVLEAMACGLPAIIPAGSAMTDFCPPHCAYYIPSHLFRVRWYQGKTVSFLEPQVAALSSIFDRINEQPDELVTLGAKAAQQARKYTWTAVAQQFLTTIFRNDTVAPVAA